MANICSNYITFTGKEKGIKNTINLFKKMIEEESNNPNQRVKPDFIEEPDRWMESVYLEKSNISLDGDNSSFTASYETGWAPNVPDMILIADRFGVSFSYEYEELGSLVYGKAVYENGELKTYELESEDFDEYEEDEDTCQYMFRGETYDSQYDILETLLEERITKTV